MDNFLFNEFTPSSSKQWKQKIQFDLKGAEYNKTLLTHTNSGVTIKPFYHADEFKSIEVETSKESFKICQAIFISDEKKANHLAKDALERGANSILFTAHEPFDITTLLNNIPTKVEIQFDLYFLSNSF